MLQAKLLLEVEHKATVGVTRELVTGGEKHEATVGATSELIVVAGGETHETATIVQAIFNA